MTRIANESGMVRRGPVKDRSCTDVLCLIVFVAFLVGWGIVGYFGFALGDPQRLVNPTDSNGRICGHDSQLKDRPYLFFFDLTRCATPSVVTHGCQTPQVCVKSCPSESFIAISDALRYGENQVKSKLICKENVTTDPSWSKRSVQDLVTKGDCASWYIQSTPVAGRCIPLLANETMDGVVFQAGRSAMLDNAVTVKDLVNGTKYLAEFLNAGQVAERIFQDYANSWWVILVCLVVAMVISFLWIVLMRFVAGVMVWLSIVVILTLQCFGLWYCYTRYDELSGVPGANQSLTQVAFTTNLETYLALRETWLAFLILLAISLVIIVVTLIFLRNRIRIAIALIGQGSKAVGHIMSTLLFPIVPWIFQVLVIGYFVAVAAYLASAGKAGFKVVGPNNSSINCSCPLVIDSLGTCSPLAFQEVCGSMCPGAVCQFSQDGGNPNIRYLHFYNLFGLFWGLFFVSAAAEMVLAGAFAAWYWAFDKPRDVPTYALTESFFRTVRYHLGTVAFGSLIIAIIRSIRVILEYIDRKVREHADNCCSRCLMCCCKCCFWALEKFMRFVNRNAYVMCALSGRNFCSSASEAFSLLLRNAVRVVVLDKVTDFLLFLGRLVIVGAVGIGSFYVFDRRVEAFNPYLPPVNYYLVPVITTTLGAFFISSVFFSVYSMAIDTIFLCFLQDSEENDGSPEKPFYMSRELMEILGKKNKK